MTANSQLLTTTPKTKTRANQATRTGTEPYRWRSHGGLSIGEWEGERGNGLVQRISSTDDRWKIDRGRVKIVQEMQKPKNLEV